MNPKKSLASEFDRAEEHVVKAEEDGHLDEHGETATDGIHPVIAVEFHHFGVQFCGVIFQPGLQLFQLGGEDLHFFHTAIRLRLGNPENGLKKNS